MIFSKVEFYVGIEFKADKTPLTTKEQDTADLLTSDLLTNIFGGFTVHTAEGKFKDFPMEQVLVYTVISDFVGEQFPYNIHDLASTLAQFYQQESVLYFISNGHGDFAKPQVHFAAPPKYKPFS